MAANTGGKADEDLARSAAAGDRAAFAVLVERHYDRVFRIAWRMTGNRAEAEDLAQDICTALPAKLAAWRAEARFTTWLYRVTVNAALDRHRRDVALARAAEGWGEAERARHAAMTEARAARDWLTQAMHALGPDLRATVALILGEGLSQAEAAKALGLSEGTVAWRMSEVKKRLREIAAEEDLA